jgi:hypothetical protein
MMRGDMSAIPQRAQAAVIPGKSAARGRRAQTDGGLLRGIPVRRGTRIPYCQLSRYAFAVFKSAVSLAPR